MIGQIVRFAGRLAMIGVLLASGYYFVYYLFGWQWQRANTAGLAFIAALIVVAMSVILRRLDVLQQAVTAQHAGSHPAARQAPAGPGQTGQGQAGALAAAGSGPQATQEDEPQFPWLAAATAPPRFGVFIPVLFATGIVVSIVASVVDRVAMLVGGRRANAGAADTGYPRGVATAPPPPGGGARALIPALVVLALVPFVIAGLWRIGHFRPDEVEDGTTELVVQVAAQQRDPDPAAVTDLVGRYCAENTAIGVSVVDVRVRDDDSAVLVVRPALDDETLTRFTGCLQDSVLDRHRLRVTEIDD